jgi:hypothetical protein
VNKKKPKKEKEGDIVKDDIIQDYDSVLKESGVLTSVSGIIFGFLLNISINSPKGFTIEDSVILMISLYSVSFAVSFFVMPIIYHHIQYPYRDIDMCPICKKKLIEHSESQDKICRMITIKQFANNSPGFDIQFRPFFED